MRAIDIETGNIRELSRKEGELVEKGNLSVLGDFEVPVQKGGYITVSLGGKDLVFVVRDVTKKDLTIRLRVEESLSLNPALPKPLMPTATDGQGASNEVQS